MQGRTSNITFDFKDYELSKKYLKSNPYPIDYIIKNFKKESLNNEYYAELKKFHIWKDDKRKILYRALRDYIIKKYKIVMVKEYPESYYVWNGFYYTPVDVSFLLHILESTILQQDDAIGMGKKEIVEFVAQFSLVERDKIDNLLDRNRGWLPFRNGVLNTRTMEFSSHNPNLFFRFCIPYKYEISKKAKEDQCPNWDKLLNLLLEDDISLKEIVEFYLGYILSQEVSKNNQYFLVFIGQGNNGKSFFLDVIRNMLCPELITTAEIEKMSDPNNRFSMASIENKILIINDDVSENVFKHPDFLKRLVGGNETLIVERKNVDPYEIRVTAKPILTTNNIPYLPDVTQGFQRRFLAVPLKVDVDKVPKEKLVMDPEGDKRMFITEYPYIIKRCLELYNKRKETFGKIDVECNVVAETRKKIVGMSSNLTNFFEDKIHFTGDTSHVIFCKDIFELYKVNYESNPRYQKKFNNFINELEKYIDGIIKQKAPQKVDKLGVKRNFTTKIKYSVDFKNDELYLINTDMVYGSTISKVDRRTSGAFLIGFVYLTDWLIMQDKTNNEDILEF